MKHLRDLLLALYYAKKKYLLGHQEFSHATVSPPVLHIILLREH